MGQMRFIVSPQQRFTDETLQQVYVTGIDRICWQSQARLDGDDLIVQRAVSESGNLYVPWHVEGLGRLALS